MKGHSNSAIGAFNRAYDVLNYNNYGWMDSTQKLDSANVQGLPLLSKRLQAQKGFQEHYSARYMICAELQIQFCESTTSSVITSI